MKKFLPLIACLLLALACTTEPPVTNAPANTNTTPAKVIATVSEADATAREKAVWEALKKKDLDAFGNMLATDYIEVLEHGVFTKAGILNELKDLTVTDATFADWKLIPIDSDANLLTYNVTIKGTHKGKAFPEGPYRAASAWVNREGKWQAFYHQETMVHPGPDIAATAATPAQTPTSSTTPTAKPLQLGSDPVANEKAVWDLFTTKNYDAFAAVLAPEFVELAPDGVYDKAGTVKAIQGMDASKFELSDWKAVKMDDDAAVVTYIVKGGNDQGRHSTIWANRAGKWTVLFHIVTPIEKAGVHPEPK